MLKVGDVAPKFSLPDSYGNIVNLNDFLEEVALIADIDSLNASVAAGVVMYEAARQRKNIKSV